MKCQQVYLTVILFIEFLEGLPSKNNGYNSSSTESLYDLGIQLGVINLEKYGLESFRRDEKDIFQEEYKKYVAMNSSQTINYQEWLIMNNFGILPDTQESLFERKITKRSTVINKIKFMNTVKEGDILIITARVFFGHAAIMVSDYWVIQMPGGIGWVSGIESNNQQIGKDHWFDKYGSDSIIVYRCPDSTVARQAASWAVRNYYNPYGGTEKIIHVKYLITPDLLSIDPSYCSKLVIQAYYFGTGSKRVINLPQMGGVIVPFTIPTYFLSPYKLMYKGKF